ncbi:hypothetical protein BCR44DRAFT_36138 [Catenaria anguillulae PL171]|uniref:Tetratricopeptide repeat-domain-containing protein n=1 Tax=Catenaria anguillulae PL171 TaxID=765915 RepID=A0A1Y2I1Z7_9FUNG|nr:hypothetical protein BCR44DRAFT_36138 [Catenaria anguillulae PL171]
MDSSSADNPTSTSPSAPDALSASHAQSNGNGNGNGNGRTSPQHVVQLSVDGNGYTDAHSHDVPSNPSPRQSSPVSNKSPKHNTANRRQSSTRSPTSPSGKSTRSAASRTPKSFKSASAANSVNPASGPLAHTLCTRLLTDGHVAAFSQAFTLLGLGQPNLPNTDQSGSSSTESTTSLNATAPSAAFTSTQHRINQSRLASSPAHVQRLCTLLTAVEDARARLPPSAPFASSPALWHATRALAVFLTDVLPDAAVEYAKQALQVAQKLTDPPTPVVPVTPSTANKPAVAAPAMSEEEAKQAVVDAHVLVGNACAQLGMWPAAMVEYRLALSVPEAVERLVYSAMQYAVTEEHSPTTLPNAIRIYKDTLLCIPPLHPRASTLEMKLRRRLGLAYMLQGDLTAAEVQLTQFLTWTQSHPRPNLAASSADWPDDPVGSVSLALAECRELAGDLEGAVIVLNEYMNMSASGTGGGPVREKVAVVLGNLLNRLNRGGAVAGLLKDCKGDKAACQLGIARGLDLFDEFMKSVNKSPQDMFRFMDEVRDKYAVGNPPPNASSATAAV